MPVRRKKRCVSKIERRPQNLKIKGWGCVQAVVRARMTRVTHPEKGFRSESIGKFGSSEACAVPTDVIPHVASLSVPGPPSETF